MNPFDPAVCAVRRTRQETNDTFTLELAPKADGAACRFKPGQFNMLYVFGVGEVPISISGDPTGADGWIHTTRAVGNVTMALWKLKAGGELGVRGPFGSAWPVEKAKGKDVVIMAGGIGLAPLRPAIHSLLADRRAVGRIILLYGARTPEDVLYGKDLKSWRSKFDIDVHVTVDRGTRGWKGNIGVVTTLVSRAPFDPRNTIAFLCGPEIMMRFSILELGKQGVSDESIYLSMERNMKCAVGFCGHCQFGPAFICKNGPVLPYNDLKYWFGRREV